MSRSFFIGTASLATFLAVVNCGSENEREPASPAATGTASSSSGSTGSAGSDTGGASSSSSSGSGASDGATTGGACSNFAVTFDANRSDPSSQTNLDLVYDANVLNVPAIDLGAASAPFTRPLPLPGALADDMSVAFLARNVEVRHIRFTYEQDGVSHTYFDPDGYVDATGVFPDNTGAVQYRLPVPPVCDPSRTLVHGAAIEPTVTQSRTFGVAAPAGKQAYVWLDFKDRCKDLGNGFMTGAALRVYGLDAEGKRAFTSSISYGDAAATPAVMVDAPLPTAVRTLWLTGAGGNGNVSSTDILSPFEQGATCTVVLKVEYR